jgi:Ca2+-binding RTX toxin-like protein
MTQVLNGGPGGDSLTGTDPGAPANPDGIDIINGLAGDDTLLGLGGDDTIQGGLGADVMDGGAGFDTLTFANATAGVGVVLNAFGTYGEAAGDTMTGFEALIGSAFNDQLAGDGGDNLVDGGDGDDYIQLSGGVDTLIGGAGRDLVDGRVVGAAINVNLTTGMGSGGGMAVGTTLSGFELVLGSAFDDVQTANLNLGTDLVGFDGADILNGANGDDQLFGDNYAGILVTGDADTLNGGDGNDRLEGGAFGDVLNGGAGVDTIVYHDSAAAVTINLATGAASGGEAQGDTLIDIENVNGTAFDDVLTGSAAANRLDGRNGDDILAGLGGADALIGGAGVDLADYSASSSGVTINLQSGTGSGGDAQGDTLSGIENVVGSAHADRLTGAAGVNILTGGDGDDILAGLGGADQLIGGVGTDTADYSVSGAGVTVNLGSGGGSGGDAEGDTLSSIESAIGSGFADRLIGTAIANRLDGGDGDDVLIGLGGADQLFGGAGIDTADYSASLSGVIVSLDTGVGIGGDAQGDALTGIENLIGSDNADTLLGSTGANRLVGGAGNDFLAGLGGADELVGGSGIDRADYSASASGVTVDLAAGTGSGGHAAGDTLTDIENLTGSAFADILTGTAGVNALTGGGGDDILTGLGGGDSLDGGTGIDTADYSASAAGVTIDLSVGTGSGGDAQGDALIGVENVTGSAHGDRLIGDAGANRLDGGDGDDILVGFGGADALVGGAGIDTADYSISTMAVMIDLALGVGSGSDAEGDTLSSIENIIGSVHGDILTGAAGANQLDGGNGNDMLAGQGGADRLIGGAGIDTADYGGSDAGVTVDLGAGTGAGGDAEGDILSDIENVAGSASADRLTGAAGANRLDGGGADDILVGLGGADVLVGAAGVDTADYSASAAGVTIDLDVGTGSGGDAEGDTLTGIENLTGSAHADRLTGGAGVNVLTGGDGDDMLAGRGDADQLIGGAGIDTADYSVSAAGVTVDLGAGTGSGGDAEGDVLSGIENVTGSAHADTLRGSAAANRLDGGAGDDTLTGLGGADVLVGGAGVDTADYSASAAGVTVDLSTGQGTGGDAQGDVLADIENITGSALADRLTGAAAANVLAGGNGDDILAGLGGADRLIGGAGIDTANYAASSAGVAVDLGTGAVSGGDAQGDILSDIESAIGSAHADRLRGSAGVNRLDGGAGDDLLTGLGGADQLVGGAGIDTADYSASASGVTVNLATGLGAGGDAQGDRLSDIENIVASGGADRLTGAATANRLDGGAGNDVLAGFGGADTLVGGAGVDVADYSGSSAGVTVSLSTGRGVGGDAQGDILSGVENLIGSRFDDVLTGDAGNNTLWGAAGNDRLFGGAGDDVLSGGLDADIVSGGAGDDTYDIDDVGDRVFESADGGIDLIRSTVSIGTLAANVERATLVGTDNLNLGGNELANTLGGNGGNNMLSGGLGNDGLYGLAGNDSLEGGAGNDRLTGGLGADSFVFRQASLSGSGIDRIADFGADDFIRFDVTSGPTGVLNADAFVVGPKALDANDRFVYYAPTGGLYYDPDGSGAAQKVLFAVLDNKFALTASDIILF